jgi:hypothetical protein
MRTDDLPKQLFIKREIDLHDPDTPRYVVAEDLSTMEVGDLVGIYERSATLSVSTEVDSSLTAETSKR